MRRGSRVLPPQAGRIPSFVFGQAELRAIGRDPRRARERELEAAADAEAVDERDGRDRGGARAPRTRSGPARTSRSISARSETAAIASTSAPAQKTSRVRRADDDAAQVGARGERAARSRRAPDARLVEHERRRRRVEHDRGDAAVQDLETYGRSLPRDPPAPSYELERRRLAKPTPAEPVRPRRGARLRIGSAQSRAPGAMVGAGSGRSRGRRDGCACVPSAARMSGSAARAAMRPRSTVSGIVRKSVHWRCETSGRITTSACCSTRFRKSELATSWRRSMHVDGAREGSAARRVQRDVDRDHAVGAAPARRVAGDGRDHADVGEQAAAVLDRREDAGQRGRSEDRAPDGALA